MKNSKTLNFSEAQLTAINHFRGPALVIAGPGSGKTAVIVNRIKNLIELHNVNPSNILVITFSKNAALNMQSRFIALYGDSYCPVIFGTFHSVFFNIIKDVYGYTYKNIISNSQKLKILKTILQNELKINDIDNLYLQLLLRRISYTKNHLEYCSFEDDLYMNEEDFKTVLKSYENVKAIEKLIDFEDMMLMCHALLRERKDICQKYSDMYRYILVDEFQDINDPQYEILKLLTGPDGNLFVVGDDDQSIYGFRGANPMIMAHFSDYYDCTKIMLSCNYRSVKSVINVSNSLINCNTNRFGKEIYTTNERGNNVVTIGCDGVEEEAAAILERVTSFLNNSKDGKMAILYRTNNKGGYIALLLKLNNIDYIMREKVQNPFDSIVFQDFIHYIHLSENPDSYKISDLIPIINKPLRYINTNIINGSEITYIQLVNLYSNKQYLKDILRKFKYNLLMLSKMDLFSSFRYFTKVIGYEDYINSKYENDDSKRTEMLEICNELEIRLKMFHSINELNDYIENEKNDNLKENVNRESARIQIMTYHASKGLEFDSVIIPDLNEGSVPNKRASSQEAIEEERRMLYVAFTRAKNNLILLYLNKSKGNDVMKSRFLIPILNLEEYVDCIIK